MLFRSIQQIRIDLPGHGKSTSILDSPSIQLMAKEVAQIIQHLELPHFNVIGHSMGAYVGLELSQMKGFKQLILVNSNCWSDSEQRKQDRLRVAQIVQHAKNSFLREAIPNLLIDLLYCYFEYRKIKSVITSITWILTLRNYAIR